MTIGTYLSIINVSGLNTPIKRPGVAEWIKNHDPSLCCFQETHCELKDTYRLKGKGWKKIFHGNRNGKKELA